LVQATIREWRKLFAEPPPVFTEAKLGHFVQALKSSQSEQLLNARARTERRSLRDIKKKRETYVGVRFDLIFVTEDRMRRHASNVLEIETEAVQRHFRFRILDVNELSRASRLGIRLEGHLNKSLRVAGQRRDLRSLHLEHLGVGPHVELRFLSRCAGISEGRPAGRHWLRACEVNGVIGTLPVCTAWWKRR